MLDGEHESLLRNFPALEELLVNGFIIWRPLGLHGYESVNAYEALGADVLSTLGDNETGQVTTECVIGYRVVPTGSRSCKMIVPKKKNQLIMGMWRTLPRNLCSSQHTSSLSFISLFRIRSCD